MPARPSDRPQSGTPNILPRPDFHFTGSVGRTYLDSDPAQFPQPVKAPAGAPNIRLILLDDVGFGQFSTFGGGVPSPTMDRLAKEGLRYNRFHTTALCSPTRAALITGRNHHSASFAGITEAATGYDGYCCVLPKDCGTVGEVLRQNGYMTAWIGRNHNTPTWETSAVGPFDHWANGLGFDNLKVIDELGGPKQFNHFPSAWAHAMNTPFQWTKQVASHFGGTRNPLILSWPSRVADKGGLRDQFIHAIDLAPTLYELCGVTAPAVLNGVPQKPVPVQFSIGEGLDIGMDGGSPVDFTYQLPFAFTGTIDKVTIELKAKASDLKEPEASVRGKAVGVARP